MSLKKLQLIATSVFLLSAVGACIAQECPPERPIDSRRTTPIVDNKIFNIEVAGSELRVLLYWDDLPANTPTSSDGTPEIVQQLVDRVDTYLNKIADAGFRTVRGQDKCGKENVLTVYLFQINGASGGTAVGPGRLDVYFSSNASTSFLDSISETLLHELFHTTQAHYGSIRSARKWSSEGTAALAQDMFESDFDNNGDDSRTCETDMLKSPTTNMFTRGTKWANGTSYCQSSIFWRYFAEQLGRDRPEPAVGADALHAYFEFMSPQMANVNPIGRTKTYTFNDQHVIAGKGDFDGDGLDELLVRESDAIAAYGGSYEGDRALKRVTTGERFGGAWKLNAPDRISAVGKFVRDRRSQFVIVSETHIGFIGANQSGEYETIASVSLNAGRFGNGWVPKRDDQILAVGNPRARNPQLLLLRSNTHLGLVGLDNRKQPATYMARTLPVSLGQGIAIDAATVVVGVGDLNGNGASEYIAQGRSGLFVFGFNEDFEPVLLDVAEPGDRLPGGWVYHDSDKIRGVGNLNVQVSAANNRDEIVIRSPRYIGILGLDAANNLTNLKTYSRGANFENDTSFTTAFVVEAVGNADGDAYAEIIARSGNTISILKAEPRSYALKSASKIDLPTNNGLAEQRPLTFANGDYTRTESLGVSLGVRKLVLSNVSMRSRRVGGFALPGIRNIRFYTLNEGGAIVRETMRLNGGDFKNTLDYLDNIVRRLRSNRTLESLWNDFSTALYLKALDPTSLDSKHYFADEQNGAVNFDYDFNPATPPVKLNATFVPRADNDVLRVEANRWSANYFRVSSKPVEHRVQLLVGNQANYGSFVLNVAVIKNNRLVRLEENVQTPFSEHRLRAGEELGIIVSTTDSEPYYGIRITSR